MTTAMDDARSLGLFKPQGAFEVHCSNCHSRLTPSGDCGNCGLIGRSEADVASRMQSDAAGTEKLLKAAIEKRKAYKPVKG